jgi:hypothetical protein
MTSGPQIWVETNHFRIEPGEDQETNPGRYGRAFASWLADRLRARGEPIQEILPEDWGWCVILARKPYPLWIGCGNRFDRTDEWGAFVTAEPNLIQRLLKRVDDRSTVDRLHRILSEIMQEVPGAIKISSEDSLAS